MVRSYIKATLVTTVVLVQLAAYAQTAQNAQVATDSGKTAAQTATNSANATAAQDQKADQTAKTGDSTSVSGATAQAPTSMKNEVTVVTTAPQAIVEQPTTVVNANPLIISRGDEIRKARERAEIETEQGIVEKLEKARLEDETKRREALFNSVKKEEVNVASPTAVAVPTAVSAPTATVVSNPSADAAGKAVVTATTQGDNSPATATATITSAAQAPSEPTVIINAPAKSEAEIRQEVEAELALEKERSESVQTKSKIELKEVVKEEKAKQRITVGGVLSTMSYPDAYNTNSDFGAGVTLGWMSPNRVGVEGTFLYSQHTIDESYSMYKEVDQQNWMVAARYNVLPSAITPVVGALLSYTRRDYTDMYDWGYGAIQGPGSASSDSLDAGLILGVEFNASKNLVLGVDYRYVTNMTTRYSDPEAFNRSIYQSYDRDYRPLEEIDYDMVAFSLKFMF